MCRFFLDYYELNIITKKQYEILQNRKGIKRIDYFSNNIALKKLK